MVSFIWWAEDETCLLDSFSSWQVGKSVAMAVQDRYLRIAWFIFLWNSLLYFNFPQMGQALVGAWWQQCLDCEQRRRRQDGEDYLIKLSLYDSGTFCWIKLDGCLQVVTSAVFACVGTAGQRCTTLRRLIVHEDLYDEVFLKTFCPFFFRYFAFFFFIFVLCLHHDTISCFVESLLASFIPLFFVYSSFVYSSFLHSFFVSLFNPCKG